jgi:hypothetical protein
LAVTAVIKWLANELIASSVQVGSAALVQSLDKEHRFSEMGLPVGGGGHSSFIERFA